MESLQKTHSRFEEQSELEKRVAAEAIVGIMRFTGDLKGAFSTILGGLRDPSLAADILVLDEKYDMSLYIYSVGLADYSENVKVSLLSYDIARAVYLGERQRFLSSESTPIGIVTENALPRNLLGLLSKSIRHSSNYWKVAEYGQIGFISFFRYFIDENPSVATNIVDAVALNLWRCIISQHLELEKKDIAGFEWWVHGHKKIVSRKKEAYQGYRLQKDYDRGASPADGRVPRLPIATGILYLDDDCGPTLLVKEHPSQAQLVYPKANKFVLFDAGINYGVLPILSRSQNKLSRAIHFAFWEEACTRQEGRILGACVPFPKPGDFLKKAKVSNYGANYETTGVGWAKDFSLHQEIIEGDLGNCPASEQISENLLITPAADLTLLKTAKDTIGRLLHVPYKHARTHIAAQS
mmetsp:Transcript_14021/g.19679  ORF Transcript_14021/g.19679 Transcript_14021/m.19679 type:complete len:410 (-) Transcript_14021:116-1345(-)